MKGRRERKENKGREANRAIWAFSPPRSSTRIVTSQEKERGYEQGREARRRREKELCRISHNFNESSLFQDAH